jgi:hypothetical protein
VDAGGVSRKDDHEVDVSIMTATSGEEPDKTAHGGSVGVMQQPSGTTTTHVDPQLQPVDNPTTVHCGLHPGGNALARSRTGPAD